jgi:hypothetical protein
MSGEKLDIEPSIHPEAESGVPLPGERVTGTLAEVFGFTIDDEARELYASNMKAIEDGRREADRIIRTL